MKVLHVITSLNDGGAQAVLYNMIKRGNMHEHIVVCLCGKGKYSSLLLDMSVDVRHLDMPRGRFRVSGFLKLFRLMKDCAPDVVQTWMYHSDLLGGFSARLAGNRNIIWGIHHSSLDKVGTAFNTRVVVWLLRWASWIVPKAVISCSKKALEMHVRLGYQAEKMRFVANGYDLDRYKPGLCSLQSLAVVPSVSNDSFVFATVARWDPQKDHANLINAASILRDKGVRKFVCLLIGPKIVASNRVLQGLIKEKNLEQYVRLCGVSTNIPEIMNFVDCHVLPSAAEAFPNVVAEALACSVPCIVTDVGDAGDMVGDDGWVVPPRDAVALALAMRNVMEAFEDTETWEELKLRCRKRALNNLNVQQMISAYEEVWMES